MNPTDPTPENSKAVKRSISFPGDLWRVVEAEANRQHRTLSNYLQHLVREDLKAEAQEAELETSHP